MGVEEGAGPALDYNQTLSVVFCDEDNAQFLLLR